MTDPTPLPYPPPQDGERCGDLVYDLRSGGWLYDASYSDDTLCWRRARSLAEAFPGACGVLQIEPHDARHPSLIPGFYAWVACDPRPLMIHL